MNPKILNRSTSKHWTNNSTLWAYMDSLGHIKNESYLKYMESARADFFCNLGSCGKKIFQEQCTILGLMEVMYSDSGFHLCNHNIGNKVIKVGHKSFEIINSIFIDETDKLVCSARFYLILFNHEKQISIEVSEVIRNIIFHN